MSTTNITLNNLRIFSLSTRLMITNDDYDNNFSIFISEYDIDEILEAAIEEEYYYNRKKVYYILFPFLFEIIKRIGYNKKTTFYFSIYQNIDEQHDFHMIIKGIMININNPYTDLETVGYNLKNYIDFMDDEQVIEITGEVEQGLRLLIIKNELLGNEMNIESPINKERVFKTDKCVVCLEKESNILFCNCGHLIACKECWENLNNKKYICMSCRKPNDIVRIIE